MSITVLTEQEAEQIAERASFMAYEKAKDELFSSLPVWMSLRQVCEYLGFGETKVRELIKQGMPVSTVGGDKRFFRPDVDKFMRGEL